ncbi:MAG: polysaccharide biosynthesis tyrosine autokinase [Duncaniella sp.]|nr:polysaccharide biosynthesis tyrosine autokinase [Duncaniella sp.]
MAKRNPTDYIDLKSLLNNYISKWYYFVISIVVCGALGFVYVKRHPREMAVRANVLIQPENNGMMANFGSLVNVFGSNGYVDDEIFVISSHSLYRDVVKKLGINKLHFVKDGFLTSSLAYPEYPVDVVSTGIADTLRVSVVFRIKVNREGKADIKVKSKDEKLADIRNVKLPADVKTIYGDFTVMETKWFPKEKDVNTTVVFSGYEKAAEGLTADVIVDIPSRKSNVISLGYDTQNPEYGCAILNEIMAQYNTRGVLEKNLQGEKTAEFIKERLSILAEDLNRAESDIQKYKEQNGIVDVASEAVYQTEKKGLLEGELLEAVTEMEILKMTRDFLRDTVNRYDLVPVDVSNEAVQKGVQEYNELALKRVRLLKSAKSGNPILQQLSQQMDAARSNILFTAEKALKASEIRLKELHREKSSADSRLSGIPTQERKYVDKKRQQEVKQQLYLFLLQKQEETAMLLANSSPKGVVIDKAYTLSEPLGVSEKLVMALFLLIGLIIPPIGIYIYGLLRNKFDTREEVEKYISAPILGEMCLDKSGNSLVVADKDTSSSSELFRLLRSNLLFVLNDKEDKVVLLTSTQSGEGKTFIAINLAASLGLLQGKKVLIIGMDIRNPQVGNYLGISSNVGLTNYLSSSDMTIDSIIIDVPSFENLDLIVAGPIPPNPAELLASPKLDVMFEELRGRYDYIIVDTAPVGMVSDTFTLNRISDATIYVTRVNYSTVSDLKFIESVYEEHRLKKLSVVINGTKSKKGYGYGYGRRQ